ncbi:hypothetical protein HK107_07960 [Parvularcula sp. ZS-1/3]|uniref:Uncharacterized protein n=1 Tax=Parvularcula mediterranea TaxID=2732508 RepID=A0A7Y3W584_9PROT|nr:hypothetical protein [Parvularcula mediterranea]NNU16253.1 hypothetical protein [Parvularcula mediterranea]
MAKKFKEAQPSKLVRVDELEGMHELTVWRSRGFFQTLGLLLGPGLLILGGFITPYTPGGLVVLLVGAVVLFLSWKKPKEKIGFDDVGISKGSKRYRYELIEDLKLSHAYSEGVIVPRGNMAAAAAMHTSQNGYYVALTYGGTEIRLVTGLQRTPGEYVFREILRLAENYGFVEA